MTDIRLYNTLSREKEAFKPLDPSHVRMYVCGPTVYDFAHVGNARPVVVFDTLYRLLKRHYPKVTYVRNITDVDDKIMAKAKETGEPINSITARTTKAYHDDMGALNALRPDIEPRATQHIPHMIALIETLIAKGHAYAAEGHVLFNVPSMPDYGQLSRRPMDELIAGARVEVAPYKKDPADFVLWKPSAPEQVGWDSRWGRGRPGWHIECSAMAKEHLGTTFDIHGGGLDLIFPHHENEIAQSRCAHDGAPLAKIWMHNGFLQINSDKMSKSLGNFFTVRDLLAEAPGEAIRLALLSAHYRQPVDFLVTTEPQMGTLDQAKMRLDRWYGALKSASDIEIKSTSVPSAFEDALCDDLNTPLAYVEMDKVARDLFDKSKAHDRPLFKGQLLAMGEALGILQNDPIVWLKGHGQYEDAYIEGKIRDRAAAIQNKNYQMADHIRDELASDRILLEDKVNPSTGKKETDWYRPGLSK